MRAVSYTHLDVYKRQIQSYEMFQDTPLVDASANGHLDVVQLLLENGADPVSYTHLDVYKRQLYVFICITSIV